MVSHNSRAAIDALISQANEVHMDRTPSSFLPPECDTVQVEISIDIFVLVYRLDTLPKV